MEALRPGWRRRNASSRSLRLIVRSRMSSRCRVSLRRRRPVDTSCGRSSTTATARSGGLAGTSRRQESCSASAGIHWMSLSPTVTAAVLACWAFAGADGAPQNAASAIAATPRYNPALSLISCSSSSPGCALARPMRPQGCSRPAALGHIQCIIRRALQRRASSRHMSIGNSTNPRCRAMGLKSLSLWSSGIRFSMHQVDR